MRFKKNSTSNPVDSLKAEKTEETNVQTTKNAHYPKEVDKVIWVNSHTQPCMGMGPMRCLQIQENDQINPDSWRNLFDGIDGFTFEPGYFYRLKIKETKLNPEEVPADASSIKRTLIEVLNKSKDPISPLNGKWMLLTLHSLSKEATSFKAYIEIKDNKLSGTDGCNRIHSSFKENSFPNFSLKAIAQTKMLCPPNTMKIARAFTQALEMANDYSIQNDRLIIKNVEGMELAVFTPAP